MFPRCLVYSVMPKKDNPNVADQLDRCQQRATDLDRLAEKGSNRHLTEMAHVARLVTLGEMMSGFAHELNQPLTAIANFADACE